MSEWFRLRIWSRKAGGWYGGSGTWRMWACLFFTLTIYNEWMDFNGACRNGWQIGWISPRLQSGNIIPVICGRVKEVRKMQEFYGAR
jgi:hypothetical protein